MPHDTVVIVGAARTPLGNLLGSLKDLTAPELGAVAIKAAIHRAHLTPNDIDEVIMGCVLPAGIGQAPARQTALLSGIPTSTPCTTINKMCGSGMKAVMLAHDFLLANDTAIVVAGGMESMTQAPYLLPKARQGYRLGHGQLVDHMMLDGLEDAYDKGRPMGYFAEECAKQYQFTRAMQDEYATTSLSRAQKAIADKKFAAEIVPITLATRQVEIVIDTDEHPTSVDITKIPKLPPIFAQDGTVTAANSSSIADGAAALTLMCLTKANQQNITPLAKIVAHVSVAKESHQFTTAPIDAIAKLLKKINWTVDQVDLFEINEAFAVVTMAAMQELHIPHNKLNILGGGCALGHPIGASGARILVTLLYALQQNNLKRGIAALCIGGGEATAIAIERI